MEKLLFECCQLKPVSPFKIWCGDVSLLKLWKPSLCPPIIPQNTVKDSKHEAHSEIVPLEDKKEHNTSLLLKKYLTHESRNCEMKNNMNFEMHQWLTSFTMRGNRGNKEDVEACEISNDTRLQNINNCRGKWEIYHASMKHGYSLEKLWVKLTDEFNSKLPKNCAMTRMADHSTIFIYTDVCHCVRVVKLFSCVYEMVERMVYVVHSHGQILSWWNGKIVFNM